MNSGYGETRELTIQLGVASHRMSNLERHIGIDLPIIEREMQPEDVERLLIIMRLMDAELTRVQGEVNKCRDLVRKTCKALGDDIGPGERLLRQWEESSDTGSGHGTE